MTYLKTLYEHPKASGATFVCQQTKGLTKDIQYSLLDTQLMWFKLSHKQLGAKTVN
jgi:hypothetical protein